ncbi:acetyl-CoA hydrolase/transferase family protein [Novosphingobium aquimarinum]|uniref:acetyl-CoA hydrolase/transferase family protein n=1 Tax=Novosphingobium aquimarinum TaxID=2682494 RepID=UPI0012EC0555|nr:acetyl-CoA hydrolase/transferase C-terminal domain-containing protein [Novosphingobium aquimarinum]
MIAELLDEFRPGKTIYLPGATGEIVALAKALADDPERMAGVRMVSCLLPGMNAFDYAALDPSARSTVFLLTSAMKGSLAEGRVDLMPLSYSATAAYIAQDAGIETAFAHVSEPDAQGQCSFGVAADFSPIAWEAAARRIAVVNPRMPRMPGPMLAIGEADRVIEIDHPLIEVAAAPQSVDVSAIAERAAQLVPDGAALQIGLGGAPAGLWQALSGHRDLRLRSGLIAQGFEVLAEAGALEANAIHRCGILCGDAGFYQRMSARGDIVLADTRTTHGAMSLASEARFIAANSAIEVDLLGQVNVEWQGGKLSSGVGGAPDFVRAAAISPEGRAMVLVPSTARGGTVSRIVPRLTAPSVSLSRDLADTVITEHGVAELRGLSLDGRAQAMIAIAAPAWRDSLEGQWRALRDTM